MIRATRSGVMRMTTPWYTVGRMSSLRSWLAPSLSLVLVPSLVLGAGACSKPESEAKPAPAAEPKAGEGAEAKAGDPKTEVAAKPAGEAVKEPTGASNPALAATVAAMIEAETSYPTALDPLLDLVPAGSPVVMVVRDVDDLLAVADATLGPVDPAMRTFAAAAGGDAVTDVARVLDGYKSLQGAMRGPDFALDKGLVIAEVAGEGVVIYGTSNPNAMPTMLRALGAEGDDLPDDCKAVDGAAGYAVCASDPETLAKYAPGKAAAVVRATLGERLGAKEVDRANVLVHMAKEPDPTKHVTLAMATMPGLVHFTAGLTKAPEELGRFMGTGASPALGLVAPGTAFTWVKLDSTAITEQAKSQEMIVRNVLGTLTGEVMMGTLADPAALVLLAGVTDPAPAGGLVALAGTQTAMVPKELPDGSSLELGVETLMIGGKDTQVLHAKLTPKGEAAAMFGTMGLLPEAWLFAVGGYVGLAFGGDKTVVEKIAAHSGAGMGPEAVRALPKPLAQGLVDGEVAMAMHLPIDALQSPQIAEAFEQVATQIPASDLPPGITPSQVMTLARSVMAPVSGLSVWMGPPKDRFVVHVAVSLMGDPRTEEGKAALGAMATVAGGGDAAAVWGELATRFAGSDRVTAYEARAGKRSDGAVAAAAMLGVVAGAATFATFGARVDPPMTSSPMVAVPPVIAAPPVVAPSP